MVKKSLNTLQEPIIVGVDDGFAATDIVIMDKGRVVSQLAIPSRARSGVHGTTVVGGELDEIFPAYETSGVKFTVGDFADAESARFDEYPYSSMNRVIIHHALRMAGLGGREVRIGTGLPLSTYYKGSEPNHEVIKRKVDALQTPVVALDDKPLANIVKHTVCPEGLAAWVDYAVDEDGKMSAPSDEVVGIIDIGGRTTDCVVMLPGRRVDHTRCGSSDIGVLNVVEATRVLIQKNRGWDIPGAAIEKALLTRQIRVYGKPQDITAEVDAAVAQCLDTVEREVNRRFTNAFEIDKFLLVGGGAYLFAGVKDRYPNVTIPADPEFANARGFAKYLSL